MTTTILPDGSACFTTTILSEKEALALPVNKRPLNYRISSELYHAVFEAIGEASTTWNADRGNKVFNAEKASEIAVRLCFKIAEEIEKLTIPCATSNTSLAPLPASQTNQLDTDMKM